MTALCQQDKKNFSNQKGRAICVHGPVLNIN